MLEQNRVAFGIMFVDHLNDTATKGNATEMRSSMFAMNLKNMKIVKFRFFEVLPMLNVHHPNRRYGINGAVYSHLHSFRCVKVLYIVKITDTVLIYQKSVPSEIPQNTLKTAVLGCFLSCYTLELTPVWTQ